jgi:uncharacterized delta-60 repeat protein
MPTMKRATNLFRVATCVAIVASAVLLVPALAEARTGTLDPGFGEGGRVALTGLNAPFRMDVSADGSVTILSRDAVNRFLPDGRPDAGFGEGGRVALDPMIEGLPFDPSIEAVPYPTGIAVDSQGRVLVFGTASDPTQSHALGSEEGSVPESWAVVLRLGADGRLDTSFGEGRGFVRSDFGLRSEVPELPPEFPTVASLAGSVDSQDRPVLLAGVTNRYPPCYARGPILAPTPRAIVRLTAAGTLDTSFGEGDGVSPMNGRSTPLQSDLGVVAGDQPFAVTGSEYCHGPVAFHLSAEGSPLLGSRASGILYRGLEFGAIDRSGTLLLRVGRPTSEVIRIAPDGRRDRRFGKDGSAPVTMPAGVHRSLRPVGVDGQGRIVLVGSFVLPPKPHGAKAKEKPRGPRRGYFLAMRLLASGKPDLTFGNHGLIAMPVGENRRVEVRQAALDPQGRLVVLLSVKAGRTVVERMLVRYLMGN